MNRKPINHLSDRQKRNLKKNILERLLSTRQNEAGCAPQDSGSSNQQKSNFALSSPDPDNSCEDSTLTPMINISNNFNSDDNNLKLNVSNNQKNPIENVSNIETDSSLSECSCFECTGESSSLLENSRELQADLASWAIDCNIGLNHTSKLLKVLRKYNLNVPADARTLFNTPRTVEIITVEPGFYSHIGIKNSILKDLDLLPDDVVVPTNIKININIDGLPLSKSSGSQFWPILGWFLPNTFSNISFKPFVIGIYHGKNKPHSSNDFLKYFIDEFLLLKQSGVIWKDIILNIELNAIICDAPAKAFATLTKGHNGYHGCGKCIQEGDYISNRMTFPELGCTLRTNETFRNKCDEDHHLGVSNLETLGIDMVAQIPLDYMHLVCLGVMKKLFQFWYKGKQNVRIPVNQFKQLNDVMMSYKNFLTNDFTRMPRTLFDIDRFKATEFRQILLYTGMVALKDVLSKDMYHHFLLLSCAIRILVSPSLCISLNNFAQDLLNQFVLKYTQFYGQEHVTYNVHNLSHLCNDVLKFGCLDNFSAFAPESYMCHLKKKICIQSAKPLPQIIKRLEEERRKYKRSETKLNFKQKYVEVDINGVKLSNQHPNNYCLLKNGIFLSITNIWNDDTEILIQGKIVESIGNFFHEPMDSRTLGIHLCSLTDLLVTYKINDICCKSIIIPYKDLRVILPLTHKCEI